MSTTAGSLEILMFSGITRLQQDMNAHQKTVGSAMKNIEGAVSSAKNMLASLGIVLGVGYFTSLIKGSIDAADHLHDLSLTTSIAVEQLAGLRIAAKQSGSELDGTAKSINFLSKNIGANAEEFKKLGITAKDPLEAFKQLSDIFVAIQDPQQRSAVMAKALGKAWEGAAPLLAEGSKKIGEMVDAGTKASGVTKEMTKQADEFNDKLVLLTGTGGLLTRFIGPLLPLLNILTDDMLEVQKKATGLDGEFKPLLETGKAVVVMFGNISFVLKGVGTDMGAMAAQLAALARGDFAGFALIGKEVTADAAKARVEFNAWEQSILGLGKTTRATSPTLVGMTDEQKKAAAVASVAAAAFLGQGKAVAGLNKELEKLLALGTKGEEEAAVERVKIWDDEQKAINDLKNAGYDEDKKLRDLGVKGEEDAAVNRTNAVRLEMEAINDARNAEFEADKVRQQERLREQKRQAYEVDRLLGDAILHGFERGEGFAKNFWTSMVNMAKTVVLRPIISAVMSPVTGAITSTLTGMGLSGGASAAGTAGGIGNLLSGASTVSNLFGNGAAFGEGFATTAFASQATSAALIESGTGGVAGAGLEAGAGMSIGAAVPYVGLAIAAAYALGAFDSNNEPPPGFRHENWVDLRKTASGFNVGSSEVPDPGMMAQLMASINADLNNPNKFDQTMLTNLVGSTFTGKAGTGSQALMTGLLQQLSPASDAAAAVVAQAITLSNNVAKMKDDLKAAQDPIGYWTKAAAALGTMLGSSARTIDQWRVSFLAALDGTLTQDQFTLWQNFGAAIQNVTDAMGKAVAVSTDLFATLIDYNRYKGRIANGLPGFAAGGDFGGGWSIVGENGPEIRYSGPTHTYRNADSRALFDDSAIVASVEELRGDMRAGHAAIAGNTRELARLSREWNGRGMPIRDNDAGVALSVDVTASVPVPVA